MFDARGKLVKEFLGVSPDKHSVLRSLIDDLLKHASNDSPPFTCIIVRSSDSMCRIDSDALAG